MYKILLVEDDKTIVMGLSFSLRQEGYEIIECGTAKSAETAVEAGNFDLAILDLSLPDGSGYDICRLIKAKSDIPVIFLTACDDEINVVMGLDMGADDYISKPFRLRELLSRIRSVLRRNKGASEARNLTIGEISIDTQTARVTKNGGEIFLTALEYRLLLTFANNQGLLMTRSQLLESIWDVAGDYVNDNTLTVYIKRLREKIEDCPQQPEYIKTVRGLGYKAGD